MIEERDAKVFASTDDQVCGRTILEGLPQDLTREVGSKQASLASIDFGRRSGAELETEGKVKST